MSTSDQPVKFSETVAFERYKPSVAYDQATDSPVYRLSELMFGSLLASYVLGFIGFLAAQIATNSSEGGWDIFVLSIKYTSISIAYAYLTASFYLSYHAGILTMHHMPLKHIGLDFVLALAHAVLFGYSMLFPRVFPIHLGVILLVAIIRQEKEHRRHVKYIYRLVVKKDQAGGKDKFEEEERLDLDTEEKRELRDFRLEFEKHLDLPLIEGNPRKLKYSELEVWKPVGRWSKVFTCILLVGGTLIWYLVAFKQLPDRWRLWREWYLSEDWVALVTSVVALAVLIKGQKIIQKRATLLYNRKNKTTKMDDQFGRFIDELQISKS